jgi:hypothetical protein
MNLPLPFVALTFTFVLAGITTLPAESTHPQPPQVEVVTPLGFIPKLEQKLGRRLEPSEKPAVSKAIEDYAQTCRTSYVKYASAAKEVLDIWPKKKFVGPGFVPHAGADDADFTEHVIPRIEAMLGRDLKSSEKNKLKRIFESYQKDLATGRKKLAEDLAAATGMPSADAESVSAEAKPVGKGLVRR